MFESEFFYAVGVDLGSWFVDVCAQYCCVLLIQNCYLQFPVLRMNLLKEFHILINFFFKEITFHDLL